MADGEEGGFWRTVPGLLTAAAGIVSAVAGLVIALSQAGLIGPGGEREGAGDPAPVAGPAIDGRWSAQVVYPWDTHTETFDFRVEEGRLYGNASFLGTPRGIEDGVVSGTRISFLTRAEEILGNERRSFENHYDGVIAPRGIQFVLTDTRGSEQVEFGAVRKSD